jgi:hypothetical protein
MIIKVKKTYDKYLVNGSVHVHRILDRQWIHLGAAAIWEVLD